MACMRCIVSGRVQGVWFRDSTRYKARELGLTGHAINLADGSVEVVACGEAAMLQVLQDWLWDGPELASVSAVTCDSAPDQDYTGFTIG